MFYESHTKWTERVHVEHRLKERSVPAGKRHSAISVRPTSHCCDQLKPSCIALSQALLAFGGPQKTGVRVTARLGELLHLLESITRRPDSLDEKLADYVFFPISQVLKASRELPVRSMELGLQCLALLISEGWRAKITSNLSAQLTIFLTLICDTSGRTVAVSQVTGELRTYAFICMSNLFNALSLTLQGKSSLTASANVPSLGHAITVIIGGASTGESVEVQQSALKALLSLLGCIDDIQVLSSFFPGIVSALTKVLTPSTQGRRHWKVLVQSIHILSMLISLLISERAVAKYDKAAKNSQPASVLHDVQTKHLDSGWIRTTAAQLKLALANINRLRSHTRHEVRDALIDFNLMILTDCKTVLKECCTMAFETVLLLADASSSLVRTRLEALVQTDSEIAELLVTVFRDEILSQVRIMQSNDDSSKERSVRKIFAAFDMLKGSDADMHILSRMLGSGLRDSVTTLLRSSASKESIQADFPIHSELLLANTKQELVKFTTPLSLTKSQDTIFDLIKSQLRNMRLTQPGTVLASDLMDSLRSSDGDAQVGSFWLILRDLEATPPGGDIISEFLVLDKGFEDSSVSLQEQLYSFSIDILQADGSDWRLKVLALESVALHAQQSGQEFRTELMDALYPILCQLGSEAHQVRNHAMTCINIVSNACSYTDVKDLIVSNVDYLVNAVALKLNAFDVSPQGPQVLLMMVQLAGPSLLPYLEDSLESIFAALEDYHGYTTLVELLFTVLRTMAEEGVKAPQLFITDGSFRGTVLGSDCAPSDVQGLATYIRQIRKSTTRTNTGENDATSTGSFPSKPWGDMVTDNVRTGTEQNEEENAQRDLDVAELPPPAPKTYMLLLKITQLTQHYLSSSSPSLRISLMSLIRTTIPALAKHENSFLPLINTLWPEVTSRLFDEEVHVVSGSLRIISTMCEYAGSFMRSRIHSLWTELLAMYRRIYYETRGDRPQINTQNGAFVSRHSDTDYVDTSSRTVWQSLTALLVTIVKHVDIDAEMFDDILQMLQPLQTVDAEVREALEAYNPDAVWLATFKQGSCKVKSSPRGVTGDWKFVVLAT